MKSRRWSVGALVLFIACTRPPARPIHDLQDELFAALEAGAFPRAAAAVESLRRAGDGSTAVLGEAVLAERAHDRALLPELSQTPDPRGALSIVHALYSIGGIAAAAEHLAFACANDASDAVRGLHCVLEEQARLAGARPLYASNAEEVSAPMLPGAPVPIVKAAIDDREPGVFIIDTGAAASVLSRSYCDREGIGYSTQVVRMAVDSAGKAVALYPAVVDRVQIAGLIVQNVPVFVMDFPPQLSIAGIIQPLDTWRHHAVELDGPGQVLRISRSLDLESWKRSVQHPVYAAPLVWVGTNVFVQATVAERDGWFLFDSGASGNSITAAFTQSIGRRANRKRAGESVSATGRNWDRGSLTAVLSLASSPPHVAEFSVRAAAEADPDEIVPLSRSGAIGHAWFRARRVLLPADGRSVQFTDELE